MDYYSTLGLQRGASDDDIKKAYRKLAMKHHPDRGGDQAKFKEISTAYEALSNPEKRRIIDMGGDPNAQPGAGGFNQGPFEFHFGTENLNDLFGNFGFGFGQRPMQRNKSLNINVEVTLEEVLTGKELNAEVGMPGGVKKIINISIPPGVESGQQIRYEGMGDNSIRNLRPGDLIVSIFIRPHTRFFRDGSSLICEQNISVWDAILGTTISLTTLDNKQLDITIPPGTQPETVMSCNGYGLPNIRSRQRGNLLIKVKINIPKNISPELVNTIQQIKNGI
jgi:DnaJ-class molecular chaperone